MSVNMEDKLYARLSVERATEMSTSKSARTKLSTTVAPETYEFLQRMVERGQAANLAEALDNSISKVRRLENRKRLAEATTRYFERLDSGTATEENALAKDMMAGANSIDFDQEI